jgi:hypothetical protein
MLTATILSFLSALTAAASSPFQGHQVLRFAPSSSQEVEFLRNLAAENNLDVWNSIHIGGGDIRVAPGQISFVKDVTKDIEQSVMIENVQDLIDAEQRHSELNKQSLVADIFSDYQNTSDLVAFLASKAGTTKFTIGRTYSGKEITGIKFGTGPKSIMFHGGIHAREWITPGN